MNVGPTGGAAESFAALNKVGSGHNQPAQTPAEPVKTEAAPKADPDSAIGQNVNTTA